MALVFNYLNINYTLWNCNYYPSLYCLYLDLAQCLGAESYLLNNLSHVVFRVWWWVWARRTATLVMRPRAREVSWPWSTPSSTVLWPTGMTWRRSGITPSTTSWELPLRSTLSCSQRPPWTPKPTGRRWPRYTPFIYIQSLEHIQFTQTVYWSIGSSSCLISLSLLLHSILTCSFLPFL